MKPTPQPPEGDYLTDDQIAALLQPLDPARVHQKDGYSHLQGWDIRAHLNRVLGFARWSATLDDLHLITEQPTRREGQVMVAYRATVTLRIHAPNGTPLAEYQEAAAGQMVGFVSVLGDVHDNAIKSAQTGALKRCAVNLGTRFGLGLYDNGSTRDVVAATLVLGTPRPAFTPPTPTEEGAPRDNQ